MALAVAGSPMITLLLILVVAVVASGFTALAFSSHLAYVRAAEWNMGYERGIEQGLREAAEEVGGPPAPIRIESVVR